VAKRKNYRRRITEADKEIIAALAQIGKTTREIANETKLTYSSVYHCVNSITYQKKQEAEVALDSVSIALLNWQRAEGVQKVLDEIKEKKKCASR
tara:strand:- start:1092 stop:1376 length:285 start_codon:yes stop_codon:yes gene_type:complete